jgi:hypothetical protein
MSYVMMNGIEMPLTDDQAALLRDAGLIYPDDESDPTSHTTTPTFDERAYSFYGEHGHEIEYLVKCAPTEAGVVFAP